MLDVSGAGVSILDEENQLRFVTASSDALIAAEEQQEQLQQGPCIDAAQLGDVVGRPTSAKGPLARAAPGLAVLAFRSVVAIPLVSRIAAWGA